MELTKDILFLTFPETSQNSDTVKTAVNSAGKKVGLWIGKLNETQNYLQFQVDGIDKGYIIFDVSRNIAK